MRVGGNQQALRSFVAGNEAKVRGRWNRHNRDAAATITQADLAVALRFGDLPAEAYERIAEADTLFVTRQLKPMWLTGAQAGGQSATAGIRRAGKSWLDNWRYSPTGHLIERWIRHRAGAMITQWGTARQGALRTVIRHAIRAIPLQTGEQPSIYYIAELIKDAFGLTELQAQWVTSYRDKLWKALTSDPKTQTIPPIKLQAIVDKKAKLYQYSMTQMRAQTIARTETAAAFNQGQFAAVVEARDEGLFGKDATLFKVWSAASDCCDECQALDGMKLPIDAPYGEHGAGGADGDTPPLHPNCRCTLYYETE